MKFFIKAATETDRCCKTPEEVCNDTINCGECRITSLKKYNLKYETNWPELTHSSYIASGEEADFVLFLLKEC